MFCLLPPLSLWFALQIFQPSFCSSSFGSVLVPLVRCCVCSCFSLSSGGFSRLPYPFLFSLAPPFPDPTPFSFVVYLKLKTKQIRIPPMHLTVQTERSAGVAAGAGTRGRARAAAPPSRRGRRELPAWRPELLQPRGQRLPGPTSQQPLPSHPSSGCVAGCVMFPTWVQGP